MGKKKYEVTHRDHKTTFPFGWFIFFIVCVFIPPFPIGIFIFIAVLFFVKFFTKIVR